MPDDNARRGILPGVSSPVNISTAVQPYLDEIPRANGPALGDGLAQFIWGFKQVTRQDYWQARYDRNSGSRGQFFARYTYDGAGQEPRLRHCRDRLASSVGIKRTVQLSF